MRVCIHSSQYNPQVHTIISGPHSNSSCGGGCGSSSQTTSTTTTTLSTSTSPTTTTSSPAQLLTYRGSIPIDGSLQSYKQVFLESDFYGARIYAAVGGNGQFGSLYISDNYGISWNDIGVTKAWTSLAIPKTQDSPIFGSVKNGKIWRSDSLGATWQEVASGKSGDFVADWFKILVPVANQINSQTYDYSIYGIANAALYPDIPITFTTQNIRDIAINYNGSMIIALPDTDDQVYKYNNGLWSRILEPDNWQSIAVDVDFKNIYISSFTNFLYCSSDYGNTWVKRNVAELVQNEFAIFNKLWCSLNGEIIIANAPFVGTYISNDFGVTWQPLLTDGSAIVDCKFFSGGAIIAAFKTPYNEVKFYTLGIDNSQTQNFNVILPRFSSSSPTKFTDVASSQDGSKLFATQEGAIYSNGSNPDWPQSPSIILQDTNIFSSIACSNDGTRIIACSMPTIPTYYNSNSVGKIHVSLNSGNLWNTYEYSELNEKRFTSVACSSNGLRMFATSRVSLGGSPLVDGTGKIFVSTNSGASWQNRGPLQEWSHIACSSDGSIVIASAGKKLYRSQDIGVSWSLIRTFTYLNMFNVEIMNFITGIDISNDGSVIVVSTDAEPAGPFRGDGGFVYVSRDGGNTWTATMNSNIRRWKNVTISSSNTIIATEYNDANFPSPGRIWIAKPVFGTYAASPIAESRTWGAIACNSTGTKIIVSDDGDGVNNPTLYTGTVTIP